jgi:hypothetical protein
VRTTVARLPRICSFGRGYSKPLPNTHSHRRIQMNTTMSRRLVRLVAGPVAVAGIIGGAMGLAAVANATTAPAPAPAQPIVYPHVVQAQPTQPIVAGHDVLSHSSRARAVETAPWPPNNQAPLLGAPASKMLGDR